MSVFLRRVNRNPYSRQQIIRVKTRAVCTAARIALRGVEPDARPLATGLTNWREWGDSGARTPAR